MEIAYEVNQLCENTDSSGKPMLEKPGVTSRRLSLNAYNAQLDAGHIDASEHVDKVSVRRFTEEHASTPAPDKIPQRAASCRFRPAKNARGPGR